MSARILFVDDSGKPSATHASRAVVIGGFAIDAERYPAFSSRMLGAKRRHYPARGAPRAWEVKSSAIVNSNPWKRGANRRFCHELVHLIRSVGGTVFTVTLDKRRLNHPMTLTTTMPLQLQALIEHFDVECKHLGRVGMVIADRSSYHQDQHASRCVASFVGARKLVMHPGVYYADSAGNEGLQAADLIAGARRRVAEGDRRLARLDGDFAAVRVSSPVGPTVKGRVFENSIELFPREQPEAATIDESEGPG